MAKSFGPCDFQFVGIQNVVNGAEYALVPVIPGKFEAQIPCDGLGGLRAVDPRTARAARQDCLP